MRLRRIPAGVLVCLALLAGPVFVASEPQGLVRLEADWIDRDAWLADPATRHPLRIRIEPFVELRDCRLSYELPSGVVFESRDHGVALTIEERGYHADGRRLAELALGTVRTPRLLRFDVVPTADPDRVPLRLTLTGRRVDGTEFRATLNLPLVPDDRPAGRLRHGAWEFDAGTDLEQAP